MTHALLPTPTQGRAIVTVRKTAPAEVPQPALTVADVQAIAKMVVASSDQDATEQQARARAVARAAIEAFWAARAPLAGMPVPPMGSAARLPAEVRRTASNVGQRAATASPSVAAYLLSTLYTCLLPSGLRAELGVFYTPPPVVDRLLDMVETAGVDWLTVRAVDPAAGGGAFVTPVAERIAAAHAARGASSAAIIDAVTAQVRGIEIDAFSGWMSTVFLELALMPHCRRAKRRMSSVITTRDALTVDAAWRGSATLVIGNPPYGKITPSPDLKARYQRSLYGHANLYGMFMDLAVQLSAPHGVIGLVTPTSFLGGQYFKNLRRVLATDAPPVAVDFIADRSGVFADVLQETALSVFAVGGVRCPVDVAFLEAATLDSPCRVTSVGAFPLPSDAETPWLLPRQAGDAALLGRVSRMPHRLADYGFSVSTGQLVWNRHKDQLVSKAAPATLPLIWSDSILPGGRFLYPPDGSARPPRIRVHRDQEHLVTRESCVLIQRTTAKEQRRRLAAAVLDPALITKHGGVVVENHVNIVRRTEQPASSTAAPVSVRAMAAFLNSAAADRVFRCISGSVAVSAYELESLPLPCPEDLREVDALVAAGATQKQIDVRLDACYGLEAQ